MTTLRERYGDAKAERMIEKACNQFLAFARKHGMYAAVAVLDVGGEDAVPDEHTVMSRAYGPHTGAGILCAQTIIDRALYEMPSEHAVQMFKDLRAFVDAQEKEYWRRSEGELTWQP